MTTTSDYTGASAVPGPGRLGAFLDSLAAQDFALLGGALAADARLRALLPGGPFEWTGAEVIAHRFALWFGETEDFELVDAGAGEVGDRLHLHWRLRLRAERLGADWFTVEQQCYADTGDDGRIAQLDLLCTGYRPERGRAQSGGGREARGRDKQSGGGREARGRDKQSAGAGEAERAAGAGRGRAPVGGAEPDDG